MAESTAVRVVHPSPDVPKGVAYWESVPATMDGVLGGYGTGTLPRVDALGSRTFLLRALPFLSSTPPAAYNGSPREWLAKREEMRGGRGVTYTRALDCGAGVGRVTEHTLLPLVDEVHLVEPVKKFLEEAKRASSRWAPLQQSTASSPFHARKGAHFHLSTLQDFCIASPSNTPGEHLPPTWMGDEAGTPAQEPILYDVVWCQWCLQHLSESDMVRFLREAKACLRPAGEPQEEASFTYPGGIIGVKENVCKEEADGSESTWYDEEDFSVTRSRKLFERIFAEAGLEIVRTEEQQNFPEELFTVQMYVSVRKRRR